MSEEAAPRTAKKRRNRWAIIALVVVAVLVLGFFAVRAFQSGSSSSTSTLQTAQVTKQTMIITVSGTGQTAPVDSTNVFSTSSGKVDTVYVAVGDSVKKGAALFKLDSATLDAALLQAQAQLKQSKQGVKQANQQVEQSHVQQMQAQNTYDNLKSQPATATKPGQPTQAQQLQVAEEQLEVANLGVVSANAGLHTAYANLNASQNSYDDAYTAAKQTTVYAPVAGVVTALNVSENGSVSGSGNSGSSSSGSGSGGTGSTSSNSVSTASSASNSSAPVVISDVSDLMATVAINEVDISKVKASQAATVTFDAITGLAIPGKVTFVSPTGTSTNGVVTYSCNVTFAKQDSRLRPDMNATVDIIAQTVPDAVVVPNAAVKVNGTQNFVQIVQPDGSTVNSNVTLGVQDTTYTQLLTGAKVGQTVVISSGTATTGGGGFGLFGGRPPGAGRSTGGTNRSGTGGTSGGGN